MSRYEAFLNDDQLDPDFLPKSEGVQRFFDVRLPEILEPCLDEVVTPETLMQAQLLVITALAQAGSQIVNNEQEKYEQLQKNYSGFGTVTSDLELIGRSPRDFYRLVPGFTDPEIEKIECGEMTIRDVMDQRPAVLLRPLFAPTRN